MGMAMGSFATRTVATLVVATDGTGDFTDIQTAINALPAGGGVVYVKEGTYTITTDIIINKSNVALIGAGKSTRIQTDDNISLIYADTKSGLFISQLYLYGAGPVHAGNMGIEWRTVTDSTIENCWIENVDAFGIYAYTNSGNIKIVNNTVSSRLNHAISIAATTAENFIIGNKCTSTNKSGIRLTGVSNTVIIGNVCDSCGDDGILIQVSCFNNVIKGNICSDNTDSGIELVDNCDENILAGNQCIGNFDGVFINAATERSNILVENVLTGNTGSAYVDNGTTTQIGHNITV